MVTEATPSERFWPNITSALKSRRLSIVRSRGRAIKDQIDLPSASLDEGSDLDLLINAIAEGRVTIVPRTP